jgi:tetratricopeptide (TPR) repeat protein
VWSDGVSPDRSWSRASGCRAGGGAISARVVLGVVLGPVLTLAAAGLLVPSRSEAVGARSAEGKPPRATAAESALRSGRYEEAVRLASATTRRAPPDPGLTIIAARAEMALGLYEAARARLEAAATETPDDLRLRHALCDLLAVLGDREAMKPLVDLTYDDWRSGRVDRKKVDHLLAVAAVVRIDDNWQDANDTLRDAVRADPRDPRPNILWGQVFLEKHAVSEAETSFRSALAVDPDNPDAHVGLAMVHLQKHYDVAAADRELDTALRVNRRHAGALAVRAEMALDGEDLDTTASLVAEIRRTNRRDPGAAWLAAARARLLDDDAGYRRERDAHAALHRADADFFASVADILIRHRRTEDARATAEEGVTADPAHARCQSVLGTTLLRLGDETAGVEALRRAWKRDPYDARTYNLLELYDKVVPRTQTFTTKHLAFRVDPAARVAIEQVVAPFLEDTYARYVAKYGFEPKGPITFELYANPEHFAVRTVGLPGIGVDAVCFGRVITSQSPTNGALNWGMVLSHELAHVFAIELSRSRVPRWFTEGLSELETMRARPEWRRRAQRDLWGAANRGELPSLSSLSNAFVRARNAEEATRAYTEAAAVLDYLDRRFGFARLRDALVRFGRGERGLDVVATAMGVSAEALETGFRSDLVARGARFDRQYLPAETLRAGRPQLATPSAPASATATATATATSTVGQADGEARIGLARLREGDPRGAARALEKARADPRSAKRRATMFLAGELALALRNADDAREAFSSLLARPADDGESPASSDGYDVRVRLALAEIHRHDLAAAEDHLRRAIAFDPDSAEATGLLVELLGDPTWHGSRDDDRLSAIAATLRLEPLHALLAKELVYGLGRRGRVAQLIEAAPLAIFIDPGAPALHAALGRALATTGRLAAAAAELTIALTLGPPADDVDEIKRLLAATNLRLRDSRRPPAPPARP